MKTMQTRTFADWLNDHKDRKAAQMIRVRIARLEAGLMGDVKPVGDGVSELRIDFGPGYRVYFARRGSEVILLLCGGSKGTQKRDIAKAKEMAAEI